MLLFVLIGMQLSLSGKDILASDMITGEEPMWYENHSLVAHAGGAIEGNTYTNSMNALEYNYAKGVRAFEIDMIFSTDCKLVCRHDWGAAAYERFEQGYDRFNPIMSAEQFKSTLIQNKYQPISAHDLVVFLRNHSDAYVITDFKRQNSFVYRSSVRAFLQEIKKVDSNVVDQVIWQIYSKGNLTDLNRVFKVDPNKVIFSLYIKPLKYSSQDILTWMIENKIKVLGMSYEFFYNDTALPKLLLDNNIKTYIYTINDQATFEWLQMNSVYGIYTDNLLEQRPERK